MSQTFSKIILIAGVLASSFLQAEKKNNEPKPVQLKEVKKIKNVFMPTWIPTLPDGQFDEKKAQEQAEILWQENGQEIQKFSEALRSGIKPDIAFSNFAKSISRGDKKLENDIFSLQSSLRKVFENREGKLTDSYGEKVFTYINAAVMGSIGFGVLIGIAVGAWCASKRKVKKDLFKDYIAESAAGGIMLGFITIPLAAVASLVASGIMTDTFSTKNDFVKVQREFYKIASEYNKYIAPLHHGYEMPMIKNAKQMQVNQYH